MTLIKSMPQDSAIVLAIKPVRLGLYLGLGYSLPVVVWLIGTYSRQSVSGLDWSLPVSTVLGVVQAIAVVIFVPWCAERADWREGSSGILMFLVVPLPLLAICRLAGTVTVAQLLILQLSLLGLALLLWILSRLLIVLLPGWSRQASIAVLQGVALTLLWLWREQ